MLKVLLFSDVHGKLEAMDLLHQKLAELGLRFDCVIFAGDFSNFWFEGREALPLVPLLFEQFEALEAPVYFIRGNRDVNIKLQASIPFDFKNGIFLEGRTVDLDEGIRLSGNPESPDLDDQTILITHDEERPRSRPSLQIAGHTHVARYSPEFINAGFLYRTVEHGGKAMNGIFWMLELDGPHVTNLQWYVLEGKNDVPPVERRFPFKEYHCPVHPQAGTWVLPFYWKKCTLCYKAGSP